MNNIVQAEAGGFIWLIVGAFWVVAQIAGAAAKKNQPRVPLSGTGEARKMPEDPIAELLRKMAGVEEFRVEPPEFAGETEAETAFARETPAVSRRNGMKADEIEKLPDIKPFQRATPNPPPPVPILPQIAVHPKMSTFRQSVPTIKLPAMNLSFHGSETSVRKVPNLGEILNPSDKNSIRRAMLSHIIFSPPKALDQVGNR